MQAKKSKKANLEIKKTVFFQIGMVTALSVIILAFSWSVPRYNNVDILTAHWNTDEIETIIPTSQEKEKIELPKPKMVSLIEIVDDEIEIDETIEIDAEADENTINDPDIVWEGNIVEEVDCDDIIFTIVEEMPTFPGGDIGRVKFLSENIHYPEMAREAGISGTVHISFVIEKDGSVSDVKLLRGIGGGCDEEAIRVIKLMPKWSPGKQLNKTVRVSYNWPILFKLN